MFIDPLQFVFTMPGFGHIGRTSFPRSLLLPEGFVQAYPGCLCSQTMSCNIHRFQSKVKVLLCKAGYFSQKLVPALKKFHRQKKTGPADDREVEGTGETLIINLMRINQMTPAA